MTVLEPLLRAQQRLGKLPSMLRQYRTEVTSALKKALKKACHCGARAALTHARQELTPATSGDSSAPVRVRAALQEMESAPFLALVKRLCDLVLVVLFHAFHVHTALLRLVLPASGQPDSATLSITLDSQEILQSLCDIANVKIGKVLRARSEANARMSLPEIAELLDTCQAYMTCCEAVDQHQCNTLRATLQTQVG